MSEYEGFLTTHILDTAKGCPAKDVRIEIFRLEGQVRNRLGEVFTNHDGRTDIPIIPKGALEAGIYELVFFIGDYFARDKDKKAHPFLDIVPIRFGVSEPNEHYHVPLLASPYSFSTYRGS